MPLRIGNQRSLIFGQPVTATNSFLTSLSAYYRMDETGTGSRFDQSSNHNTLSNSNGVVDTPGKIGNASLFAAASSQSLTIADNASFDMRNTDFTFAGWFQVNNTAIDQTPMCKGAITSAATVEWDLFWTANSLRWRCGDGSTLPFITSSALISANTWYWLLCEYILSSHTMKITINNSTTDTNTSGPTAVQHTTNVFALGKGGASNSNYSSWKWDEVWIGKRLLTTAEKAYAYNNGNGKQLV